MKTRFALSFIFGTVFSSGVGVCEPVSVAFWSGFTGPDGKYIQEIVDDFNREHEGRIKAQMVVMPWLDFYNKVALALRSKRGPDVGVVHYGNVYNMISQGIVAELDPYIDQFPQADFVRSAWEISGQNGRRYGIPLDFHPLVLYWNKRLFAEVGLDPESPPTNREEFLKVCRVFKESGLKKNGQQVWGCMLPSNHPNFLIWQHILFGNGGRMFNQEYTVAAYDSSAGEDALQFLHDLLFTYEYSSPNLTDNECMESFRRGTSAMHINGIWMLPSFKETDGLNFGARAAIHFGEGEYRVWSGSHTMMVFKKRHPDPAKKEASITFVKYISEHSYQWARSGMIPARYSILASPEFKKIPFLPQIAADIDRFSFPAPHYRYLEGIVPISEQINLCLLNKVSPESALKKAAQMSTRQLAQDPD